ncbi:MAG TPA: choice-of-anchor B family protein, partial [Bacteroidetes bacterium]|nr:choice-of-anchor B family protein [Bacteroidota bacterium]
MMKKTLLSLLFASVATLAFPQFNMTLLDAIDYGTNANDIWGWVDPDDGTEYALVGLRDGLSIVDLTDPEDVVEVQFVPGPNSTWRDIKTWGNHVYVTNETGNGLLVVDMSDAPDSITWYEWAPDLPDLGQLSSCHNLYIDEFGYCYLSGCNINGGGMVVLDVFSDPGNPIYVAPAPPVYAHDVYVRDNKMYASEIYAGSLSIYDVSDKQNITLLGSTQTPYTFTHNAWLNDAGDVAFTTDEKGNAPVTSYDVSD